MRRVVLRRFALQQRLHGGNVRGRHGRRGGQLITPRRDVEPQRYAIAASRLLALGIDQPALPVL